MNFTSILCIAFGLLIFCAGFFDLDRESARAKFWIAVFGNKWANRFHMFLGVLVMSVGVWFAVNR